MREQKLDQTRCPKDTRWEIHIRESESNPKETGSSSGQTVLPKADHTLPCPSAISGAVDRVGPTQKQGMSRAQQTKNSAPDSISPNEAPQREICQETSKSKRCKPTDAGEDPHSQRAKRMCLGRPPATAQTYSTECTTQTLKHDPLPLLPIPQVEVQAESKAFPVTECKKTTVEVELLTPGKQAQRLPLTSNNTTQTNQNRLAASLRGLSVKPASSGSSISSRSTIVEEGSENVPRTSRLRRLKRS